MCKNPDCKKSATNKGTCTSKLINHCKFDRVTATYTITKPGSYTLSEDVKGTVIIATSGVCLDLCCHYLDANGAANAVHVQPNLNSISIFNGRIINSIDAGILIDTAFSVNIFDLSMLNNSLDAIRVTNSDTIEVKNVSFFGQTVGERALLFNLSRNLRINTITATYYLSTIGAVLQFDSCNTASVQDVDVTNCTKTSGADVNEFDPGTAFVAVTNSTGVDFVHVKVNNNTFNNNVAVSDQNDHWRTAEGIQFSNSNSCSLYRCETNNNTDIAGNVATTDTEDYLLNFLFCSGCEVREHQSNSNTCTAPILYFEMITVFDSNSVILDTCQANNNLISELFVSSFLQSEVDGIELGTYFTDNLTGNSHSNMVLNCQANNNILVNPGAGRTSHANAGLLIGIHPRGVGFTVDNCQASHNTISNLEPFSVSVGIVPSASTNTLVSNCITSNNQGAVLNYGIALHQVGLPVAGLGVKVVNCISDFNGTYGISVGLADDLNNTGGNVEIVDCFCSNNSGTGDAAGIIVQPLIGGTTNVVIKGCEIYDTTSVGANIAGIKVTNAVNVVIEDTNVFRTIADGFMAHGILFDTVNDSKIIRTQFHGNQNDGIRVTATSFNNLVQDNYAVDNGTIGFNDLSAFANAWLGNKAQVNGTDYSGVAVGNISTYTKATGTYAGGTAPLIYATTNLSII